MLQKMISNVAIGVKHVLQKESTVVEIAVEIAAVGDFQLLKLSFTNIATLKGDY